MVILKYQLTPLTFHKNIIYQYIYTVGLSNDENEFLLNGYADKPLTPNVWTELKASQLRLLIKQISILQQLQAHTFIKQFISTHYMLLKRVEPGPGPRIFKMS